MNTKEDIVEKAQQAKPLDFGTIFSDSIELFKKTWMHGFLLNIFTMIVVLPLIIIMYIPLLGIIIAQAESGEPDPEAFNAFFAGMSIMYIIFFIVGIFVVSVIAVALRAGFFRIVKRLDYDQEVQTSDFFYFLKGKYFGKIFMLMLASFFVSLIATILCFLPLIYVMVPMSFFVMFFAFNPEMSVNDIVKSSFALGNKKWLLAFGLIIVCSLLAQIVGFILCGIGTLFTAPFVYHPLYLIYKNVIGFEDDKPINHIVD